ncbi:MAG: hypothetical protein KKE20_02595 [Nanoarchaeota archaeon]|nr:hypothetical protein [Nanoarchaeota archaeon]
MARIIYGVCGEGMGHAIRSRPVLDHLSSKHNLEIFSSKRAHDYLSSCFKNVNRVPGAYIDYNRNSVLRFKTVLSFLKAVPGILGSIRNMIKIIESFKPDLMISDYEIVTAYAAMIKGIPLISIDNQNIIRERLCFPKKYLRGYLETKIVNRINIPKADHYIVTSFFMPESKPTKIKLVPPILRKSILTANPKEKDYVLVYQTTDTNKELIEALKEIDMDFIVSGFRKNKREGNITFVKFKEDRFVEHLSGCKALITNGGFTLISEALHLGKPILSIPVKDQFEQTLNAFYLDKMGYGRFADKTSKEEIERFIKENNKYRKKLRNYKKQDNSIVLKNIDRIIDDVC